MPTTIINDREYNVITHIVKREVPLLVNGDVVMETVRGTKGAKQRPIMREEFVSRTQLVRVHPKKKLGRRKRLAAARAQQQATESAA